MGFARIRVLGEVVPMVPWGYAESDDRPSLRVVTKAGSFGADDTVTQCIRFLTGKPLASA